MQNELLLEAILFGESEPLTVERLASIMNVGTDEVVRAITTLKESLEGRGIVLIESPQGFALGTHPEASKVLDQIRKDDLMRELSKSAVETLAIILYGENVSKGDIDFIRGVNSGFILRNLSVRGLIEKLVDENDGRKYIYRPTLELMQSLGITSPADLENREEIKNTLLGRVVEHNKQIEEEQ